MVIAGVIGIDIGTSGCKCIFMEAGGRILASANREYPVHQTQTGWSEQDPGDWWAAARDCVREVISKAGNAAVMGVSFSGQMHGMVALDRDNQVVRRAILWNDQRTVAQCGEITDIAGGLEGLLGFTNNRMLTGYTGGKMLWMKQNEPDNYARTRIILNPKDYIRFRLTGECVTEVSDASGYGLLDVAKRDWAWPLIDKIGFERSLFPKVVESTEQTGCVNAAAAEQTGLPEGTPVYGGGGDAVISTTGMGLVLPGKVGVTLGTSGVVAMGLPSYMKNPEGNLQVFCNNKPGAWHAMGVTLAAAGSYQWLRNTLGDLELQREQKEGVSAYDLLNALAEQTPPGSDGLLFLPYLTGERCPLNDAEARGGFIGITSRQGKGHFVRAVLEGVTFSLKQVYDLIASLDVSIESKEVIVSGGGARSQLWRQIIADVFQMPVYTVYGSAEGGAFGAALVAGTGCGLFDSLENAMALAKPDSETLPRAEYAEMYRRQYGAYVKMYDALKWYFHLDA